MRLIAPFDALAFAVAATGFGRRWDWRWGGDRGETVGGWRG